MDRNRKREIFSFKKKIMKFVKSISLVMLFSILGISGAFAQNNESSSDFERTWRLLNRINKDNWVIIEEPEELPPVPVMKPIPLIIDHSDIAFVKERYEHQPAPQDPFATYQKPFSEHFIKSYQGEEDKGLFTYNMLEDVYVVVFGDFGGEEQFFDQYQQYAYNRDVLGDVLAWMKHTYTCNSSIWINLERRHGYLEFLINQHANTTCPNDTVEAHQNYQIFPLFHPTAQNQDETEVFIIPLRGIRHSQAILLEAISDAQSSLNNANNNEYTTALQIRNLIESFLTN